MKKVTIISAGGCIGLDYKIGSILSNLNSSLQVFSQHEIPKAEKHLSEFGEIVNLIKDKPSQKRGVIPNNFYKLHKNA